MKKKRESRFRKFRSDLQNEDDVDGRLMGNDMSGARALDVLRKLVVESVYLNDSLFTAAHKALEVVEAAVYDADKDESDIDDSVWDFVDIEEAAEEEY